MLDRFCTVDEPLSGPERSKLVEEGSVGRARSTRGAAAVARPCQRLGPSEQPLRRTPIAPVVGLDRVWRARPPMKFELDLT